MRISEQYQALQAKFHLARPDYGMSGHRFADAVMGFAEKLGTRDILDYGCGKASLQKQIPYPIHNYDPCMPEYSARPAPAVIVTCTDVLEHIEPECLDAVLDDLRDLTRGMLFLTVATRPAKKFLPDGRNAHLIQETANWWLGKLLPRMALHSFQNVGGGEFHAVLLPFTTEKPHVEVPEEVAHG